MSFQSAALFCAAKLLAGKPNCGCAGSVCAGSFPWNQSKRRPRLSVSRLILHWSCANRAWSSPLTERSWGARNCTIWLGSSACVAPATGGQDKLFTVVGAIVGAARVLLPILYVVVGSPAALRLLGLYGWLFVSVIVWHC